MVDILQPPEQQEDAIVSKAVIVVDDDPSNADMLGTLLQLDNRYRVTCFRSAHEVLKSTDMIQELDPSLFVLDYKLSSMTGMTLYEQLHAMEKLTQVPAIMVSASLVSDEEKERMKQLGLILVPKPYDIDDFLALVEQMIGGNSAFHFREVSSSQGLDQ